MGAQNFIHLLFNVVEIKVAGGGGKQTILGIKQLGARVAVVQGAVNLVGDDLVKTLRDGRQRFHVVVIERAVDGGAEDLLIDVVQHQIDGIGGSALGEFLSGKDDAVTVKNRFEPLLAIVLGAVADLGGDAGGRILQQGFFDGVGVGAQPHLFGDFAEAAQADGFGGWPPGLRCGG